MHNSQGVFELYKLAEVRQASVKVFIIYFLSHFTIPKFMYISSVINANVGSFPCAHNGNRCEIVSVRIAFWLIHFGLVVPVLSAFRGCAHQFFGSFTKWTVTTSAFEMHCLANFHFSLFLIIIIIVNFSAQQFFMKLPIIIQLNNVFD